MEICYQTARCNPITNLRTRRDEDRVTVVTGIGKTVGRHKQGQPWILIGFSFLSDDGNPGFSSICRERRRHGHELHSTVLPHPRIPSRKRHDNITSCDSIVLYDQRTHHTAHHSDLGARIRPRTSRPLIGSDQDQMNPAHRDGWPPAVNQQQREDQAAGHRPFGYAYLTSLLDMSDFEAAETPHLHTQQHHLREAQQEDSHPLHQVRH